MPDIPGKSKRITPSKSKTKKTPSKAAQSGLNRNKVLTRAKALRRLEQLLKSGSSIPDEVLQILSLFQFHLDELTEAGVPYEVVRALENRHSMLFE